MSSRPLGIIGVGLVGSVLAKRLLADGHAVHGFDTQRSDIDGIVWHHSPQELCQDCQTIFLSLPNSSIVTTVLDDILPTLDSRHIIIDTSTGDPADAEAHVQRLQAQDTTYIEATIAGSSDLLSKRQAGLFLAGDEEAVARLRPLFDMLSEQAEYLGQAGAASRFKLVFNLVLGLHRSVLAEALHFGESLGFDPTTILKVLSKSPAMSPVMHTKGQKMVERSYEPPQARLSQHLKDVRLMLAEAERQGIHLPLCATNRELLERAETLGFGTQDTASVREALGSPPKR